MLQIFFRASIKYSFFIVALLMAFQSIGQDEKIAQQFGVQAGINNGILSGGAGPSFSIHYGFGTNRVFQAESMLFGDYHSGSTFLTGYDQENFGLGLAVGGRINFLKDKAFNPSIALMGGIGYGTEKTSEPRDIQGFMGVISVSVGAKIHNKHMIDIGVRQGHINKGAAIISSLYIEYGYWF
jgi:hypothetical protein